MDVVIKYDNTSEEFNIYESSSQTLLKSKSLSEGLTNFNLFLKNSKLIPENCDLLAVPDMNYHIDSTTMKEIITGNMNLLRRLQNNPSEFKKSSNRFNGDSSGVGYKNKSNFSHGTKNFGKHFSGDSGFRDSYKKWFS